MASGSQLNRLPATCSTTKALTPATVHPGGRSPRLSRYTFPTFRLQPRGVPRHRFTRQLQRTGRVSDFAMNEQARRHTPPNRVRHPADRQFASGCSPPRLATTQLPSASGSWLAPARTYTVLFARLHGRTIPAFAGMTNLFSVSLGRKRCGGKCDKAAVKQAFRPGLSRLFCHTCIPAL